MNPRLILLLGAALLMACMPTDSPRENQVTREFTFEYQIDTVFTGADGIINDIHYLGVGFRHGGFVIPLYGNEGDTHETGPSGILYTTDSLVMYYNLPGSKAAWQAVSPKLASLDSIALLSQDTASVSQAKRQYDSIGNDYGDRYAKVRSYPVTACSFSASGHSQVPSGNIVFDVPLVFSSVEATYYGIVLLLDLNASKPKGVSSIELIGQTATGSIRVTCPDPN